MVDALLADRAGGSSYCAHRLAELLDQPGDVADFWRETGEVLD